MWLVQVVAKISIVLISTKLNLSKILVTLKCNIPPEITEEYIQCWFFTFHLNIHSLIMPPTDNIFHFRTFSEGYVIIPNISTTFKLHGMDQNNIGNCHQKLC